MFYSNTALLPLQDDKIDARAGSDSRLNARPAVHIGGVFNGFARTGKKFVLGIAFFSNVGWTVFAGFFLSLTRMSRIPAHRFCDILRYPSYSIIGSVYFSFRRFNRAGTNRHRSTCSVEGALFGFSVAFLPPVNWLQSPYTNTA